MTTASATALVLASNTPEFVFEDGNERPLCETCLARMAPVDHNALAVLRVVRDAVFRAPDTGTATDFLWVLGQGLELMTEDLENIGT